MKETKTIQVNAGVLETVQAAYEDYRAKQDILHSIFDLHKFDTEDALIKSVPFQAYEKKFAAAKYTYDVAMQEVQKNLIPPKYQKENFRFEIDFDNNCIKIMEY